MAVATVALSLECGGCGFPFDAVWSRADGQLTCPRCEAPVCPCGCGEDMSRMRAGALYRSEACRKRVERADNPDKTRTGIRSGNVRSTEEAAALQGTFKEQWERRILERIRKALDEKGEYHADDCGDLLTPAAHCNLIGVQVNRARSKGAIVKVGSRRNSSPASNSRWSGVYHYAEGGREKLNRLLAGMDTDAPSPGEGGPNRALAGVGVHSGEKPARNSANPEGTAGSSCHGTLDRPAAAANHRGVLPGAGSSSAVDESGAGGRGQAVPESQPADATPGVASPDQLHIGDEDSKVPVAASSAFNPENEWA